MPNALLNVLKTKAEDGEDGCRGESTLCGTSKVMQDDGFIIVKSRHRTSKKSVSNQYRTKTALKQGQRDVDLNEDIITKKVCDSKAVLRGSQFLQDTEVTLKTVSASFPGQAIGEIICYGLGNFSECLIARYQLALLLLIKESFDSTVFVHDPVFYEAEVKLIEKFGLNIILENEEGKRKLKEGVNTLLYFPHCSKQLTNNFLWCNWGLELKTCVLFGNSFSSILSAELGSNSKASTSYIQRIHPHTDEFELENNFKHQDIFNNTSIHTFPADKLSALEPGFWEQCEEPVYGTDDTEFISNF